MVSVPLNQLWVVRRGSPEMITECVLSMNEVRLVRGFMGTGEACFSRQRGPHTQRPMGEGDCLTF